MTTDQDETARPPVVCDRIRVDLGERSYEVLDYGRAGGLVLIGGHCTMALGGTDGRLEAPDVRLVGVEVPPHLHEGVPTELLNHGGGPLEGHHPLPHHASGRGGADIGNPAGGVHRVFCYGVHPLLW